MIPNAKDLFDEVPITHADLLKWCRIVAGVTGSRCDLYIIQYHVLEKVRRAKLDGSFYRMAADTPHALDTFNG